MICAGSKAAQNGGRSSPRDFRYQPSLVITRSAEIRTRSMRDVQMRKVRGRVLDKLIALISHYHLLTSHGSIAGLDSIV